MGFGVSRDPPIPLETLFGFGFGSWVSHLMVPELEQRSALSVPARRGNRVHFFTFSQKKVQVGSCSKPGF